MLAMISHDLRTPLTRMKLQLELMEESEESKGLKQDILTMQQMINSYLDFAKGESTEEFEDILLLPWMERFFNKWSHVNIEFIKSTNLDKLEVRIKPNSFEKEPCLI